MIRLVVLGIPMTQGSKTGFVRNGRVVMVEGKTKKARSSFDAWRQAIASEAREAMDGRPMLEGPVVVRCHFGLLRPASAPKKRRTWPMGARSGDVDKLARAAFDALTGVVFGDDAVACDLRVTKDYAPKPGVVIEVEQDWIGAAVDAPELWDDWFTPSGSTPVASRP